MKHEQPGKRHQTSKQALLEDEHGHEAEREPTSQTSALDLSETFSERNLAPPEAGWLRRLQRWFISSSFSPSWLPEWLQHPLFGYLVALLIQGIAVLISLYLDQGLFIGSLAVLGIAIVALSWGVAPSVMATLIGALLFDYIILQPRFSFGIDSPNDFYQIILFIATGLTISIVASQTERARRRMKRFADSLAKEHERLETIIQTLPDVVSIYDRHARLLHTNELGRQSRIFGSDNQYATLEALVQAQEALTLTGEPLTPEDLPVNQALHGVTVEGREVRFRDNTGAERFISISAAPLRNMQGQIDGVVSITRDLSALHHSEREAAIRARELEALIDAMADGLCVVDQDGGIVRANAAYENIIGLTRESRDAFWSLSREERHNLLNVHDEHGNPLPYSARPEGRILNGEVKQGSLVVDVQITNLTHEQLQLNVSGAPLYDKDGKLVAALSIWRDVTERRRLERRTHEALDALLAMAEALVARSDEYALEVPHRTDSVRKIAPRMAELTSRVLGRRQISIFRVEAATGSFLPVAVEGLASDDGANWLEYVEQHRLHMDDPAVAHLIAQLQAGENVLLDMQSSYFSPWDEHISQNQTALLAPMKVGGRLIGFIALGQDGSNLLSSADDMALAGAVAHLLALVFERERLLHEQAEAQATELALRTANQRMEEFLGMISHELKTPLTSMKGNTQLAIRQLRGSMQTFERIIGLYEATEQQSRRLNRLVDDLLDVSRSQAGHLELIAGPCDLRDIVHDALQEQRKMWPDRHIELTMDEGLALPLTADADRIMQVISNYLNNALKYSEAEHPVYVKVWRDQDSVCLSVRDEGPGLPLDQQERIWDRFHRVPGIEVRSSTHFSQSGLGLGLYISKTIIEDQHGRVGVESIPGQGATFWFRLPLRQS